MYVDLSCNINRTFLSADKCTKTVISITEAILDKTQGCLLVDLLVSIRLPPMIQQKSVLLLLARLLVTEYETLQEHRYLLLDLLRHHVVTF